MNVIVVGEILQTGINQTYSSADATGFDGIIVTDGAANLFTNGKLDTRFPADRPLQILVDGYRWGKPVGALGDSGSVLGLAGVTTTAGVFTGADVGTMVTQFEEGLRIFRFADRFPIDAVVA